MSFKPEMVADFRASMSFLIDSMLETMSYVAKGNILGTKPSCAVQTEKFFSFFEKIQTLSEKDRETLLENMRVKVVTPVYESNSVYFMQSLVGADGNVEDAFVKVPPSEDGDSLKIRTTPDGIFFQASKVFLPISEVYMQALKASKKHKLPFPNKILLGFYAVIYHAIKGEATSEVIDFFTENIQTLGESLDVCDDVQERRQEGGPMGMIKNLLGNIDFNQIGDMMAKVSGDERSSKEFGEVFGKLSETIKSGGNPMDVMGDIIKQAAADAASSTETQTEEAPVEAPVEAPAEAPAEAPTTDTLSTMEEGMVAKAPLTETVIEEEITLPESGL